MKRKLLEMLEKASKLCEDEDYNQALKFYQNILQIDSNNITAMGGNASLLSSITD